MLTTREHVREDRELRELERLWEAPAALEPLRARASLLDRLPQVPGLYLACAWALFFLAMLVFEPAPQENAVTPLWGELVVGSWLVAILAAGLVGGFDLAKLGFGLATVAGALGVVIAVACHTSGHHLGNFWLVELGATAALTGAAASGLVDRLRRS